MTKTELKTLYELLMKLHGERMSELDTEFPEEDVYNMDPEELYELDDYDRLIEGLDIVIGCIVDMKGVD